MDIAYNVSLESNCFLLMHVVHLSRILNRAFLIQIYPESSIGIVVVHVFNFSYFLYSSREPLNQFQANLKGIFALYKSC